jgi:hypothetical protein
VRTIAGHVIIALAVRIGRTRLIDNFMLEVQPAKNLLTIPLPQNSLTGR